MINFEINGDKTKIDSDYNFEVYQEIKKVNDALYNMDDDTWEINTEYLKHLVKQLHKMNEDVSNIIPKLKELDNHKQYQTEYPEEKIKTLQIKIVKENPKSLVIGFDYDPTVLEIVKQIEGRAFVAKEKAWRIGKGNEDWLYDKLNELGYVELSNLLPYTSYHNQEEVSLSFSDFPKMSPKIDKKDFQLDVTKTLLRQKKIINALEAGLGKTIISIMACEYLNKPTLIVCPASIKYNWEMEIYKINPDAEVTVLEGKDEWNQAQYTILNYDIVNRFMDEIMSSDFEVVVFDEAHKLRGIDGRGNPSSIRAKSCVRIAENKEYVFPITATPFINQTKDIFNLLKVIDHPSTDNWYKFANTYCGAENNGFGTSFNGSSNQDKLNSRLYPNYVIRLRTEDHVDLKGRVRNFIPTKINIAKYNKAIKDYMDNRHNCETNGQHLVYLNAARKELAIAKSKKVVNMVKDLLEQNLSVVLFTNYTDVADYLYEKFNKNAVKVTGDVSAKNRQKAVEEFQEGKKKVFVGNIDAAGEGITLTKSHRMIVNDFHWSPVTMVNQMEKRIDRYTQENRCIIDYLYSPDADMDNMMLSMLEDKLNDSSMIIDGKKETFFTEELIKNIK